MSDKKRYPELAQEEIDAIRKVMEEDDTNIDRYFLLKLQATLLLSLYFSIQMLWFPTRVIYWLQVNQEANPEQMSNVLTYRGVFVLFYVLAAIISWKKNLYTELVFGSAAIMASANFLFDIPYLWSAEYSSGWIGLAFAILIRVTIIGLLISIFRNLNRASYLQGKLFINPFAAIKLR